MAAPILARAVQRELDFSAVVALPRPWPRPPAPGPPAAPAPAPRRRAPSPPRASRPGRPRPRPRRGGCSRPRPRPRGSRRAPRSRAARCRGTRGPPEGVPFTSRTPRAIPCVEGGAEIGGGGVGDTEAQHTDSPSQSLRRCQARRRDARLHERRPARQAPHRAAGDAEREPQGVGGREASGRAGSDVSRRPSPRARISGRRRRPSGSTRSCPWSPSPRPGSRPGC